MRATTGGSAKKPRPVHVKALRQADKVVQQQRKRQKKQGLSRRQQQIVKLSRQTVTAKPHEIPHISKALQGMNLTAGEKRLASRAAVQHGKRLRSMQPGLRAATQDVLQGVGLGGAAHPIRRLQNPGGELMFPGFGKNPARLLKGFQRAPKPPAVAKVAGPLTREQAAGSEVRAALNPARRAAAEQKKVYSAARREKFGKAQAAGQAAGGGIAGYKAELGQLKGSLPKVKFERLKNGTLNQDDLESLFKSIEDHPDLAYGETLTGRKALIKAFQDGTALAPHEIAVLSKAFGGDVAQVLAHKSFPRKVGENALGLLNLPRAMMASVDVSFPGRQGLGVLAAAPHIWVKGFPHQFKGLVSEAYYQKMLGHFHEDPHFPQALEAGVKFTELGKGAQLREEPFATSILTNRPVKFNPIRMSARAYTLYGDYVRLELFKKYLAKAERQGVNVENKNELRGIAKVVNTLSGRGGGKRLQQMAPVVSPVLFAPQLIASRLNMLNPVWYSRMGPLTPFARRQAKIAAARGTLGAGAVLGGAALAGAKVQSDPRNADFAKVRVGNTRIDILGGLQQYPRAASQIASGKIVSSTTGKTMKLGPGFGQMNRKDILERFAESKLSPPASVANDLLKGKTFLGEPISAKDEALSHSVPLSIQDAVDLYRNGGSGSLLKAIGGYGLAATGVGVQTYGPKDRTKKIREEHDKLTSALEQNVQHYFHIGLTPKIKKALRLRQVREIYLAKHLDSESTAVDRYNAQIDLMRERKMISLAQARHAKSWAVKQKDEHVVRTRTSSLGHSYFGGDVLSSATKKIRDRGGMLYLSDY